MPTTRIMTTTFQCRAAALLLAVACSAPGAAAAQPAARTPPRPNILWISAEDLSPDLGSYGDAYARTPTLDRLASQGSRYSKAFASAPVCAPSRSAIITGMYPTAIGSMHMRSKAVPPAGVRAFTEYLRAAGYYCTNNSKTDYNFEAPPSHRPPDSVWDETGDMAHWRNRPDRAQPFFAVMNLTVTHESQIRAPANRVAANTARLTADQRHDPVRAVLPPYYPDTPLVRRDWANYHDIITAMDYQVADILAQLEADGLADSTVVFFWGDHGRGLPRAKRWPYDSGLRVPLIVRWPGTIAPGTVNDELVSLVDLGPTVLSVAGVPIPPHMQAQAFLGGQKATPREYTFAHRDRMDEAYDMIRSARDGRYRYIRNFHPGRPYAQHIAYMEEMPTMMEMRRRYKDHMNALAPEYGKAMTPAQLLFFRPEKPPEELYDLDSDPHEIDNLAGSQRHAPVLARMRAALERWQATTGDLGMVPEAELRERMRPGGVWQQVAAPTAVARVANSALRVTLSSATEGASIVYTTESSPSPHWRLYTGQVDLPGAAVLRAKACRLGYLESREVVVSAADAGRRP
jgi:uncharacterized sulfatase